MIPKQLNKIVTVNSLKKALKVALVVGTILNLFNQKAIFTGDFLSIDKTRFILNYLTPFLVSIYSIVSASEPVDESKNKKQE